MSELPNSDANDWQLSLDLVEERGAHILKTGAWSNCAFLVGTPPVILPAHRLFLAMASPVFAAMLYGPMAEGNKPIPVADVPTDVFKSMLEYIYTSEVVITSLDTSCQLYYAAKKYMLDRLSQHCVTYLQTNLHTSQVCQVYEMAVNFEETALAEMSLRKIRDNTQMLLHHSCFEEASIQTVQKIFSQDNLSIDSELALFRAAERYLEARVGKRKGEAVDALSMTDSVEDDNNVDNGVTINSDDDYVEDDVDETEDDEEVYEGMRTAVKQIRFLSLTPHQFAEHVAGSPLLEPEEALNLLIALINKETLLPEGFSLDTTGRQAEIMERKADLKNHLSGQGKADYSIEYTVHNFKTRKRRLASDVFYLNSAPFRLELTPDETSSPKRLHVEVVCTRAHVDLGWSCKLKGTVSVVNDEDELKDLVLEFKHIYTRSCTRGATRPLTWEELCDPGKGLLWSNTLVFEVHVSAVRPKPASKKI